MHRVLELGESFYGEATLEMVASKGFSEREAIWSEFYCVINIWSFL